MLSSLCVETCFHVGTSRKLFKNLLSSTIPSFDSLRPSFHYSPLPLPHSLFPPLILHILPPFSFVSFLSLQVSLSLSLPLSPSLSTVVSVAGDATLSESNCTDVNDILLMLSATSDTGARRGHSAAQTQGWSQTMYRNSSTVKSNCARERVGGEEKMGAWYA